MKSDVKDQWLKDLRSGEYEQGEGALHADGKYCCLGVLCESLAKLGLPVESRLMGSTYSPDTYGYHIGGVSQLPSVSMPEDEILELAGIEHLPEWRELRVELTEEFFEQFPGRLTEFFDTHWISDLSELSGPVEENLDALNDKGFTFDEIAWLIEHQM